MDIKTVVENAQGGAFISNVAEKFGLSLDEATEASEALMDEVTAAIERRAISRGGLADVVALLGETRTGRALHDPHHIDGPETRMAGNHVLDVLVGSKHQSRGIANSVARDTGIASETLKKLLPIIASAVVGGLQRGSQAAFAKSVRDIPGLGGDAFNAATGILLPLPGDPAGQSSSTGTWGDELPRTGGTAGGGAGGTGGGGVLLPLPGDSVPGTRRRNRYDDLSDVLRKGKTRAPQGGSLENLIRSILGNLLGTGNRGIVGSIIRVLILRYGMKILNRILGRILPGV